MSSNELPFELDQDDHLLALWATQYAGLAPEIVMLAQAERRVWTPDWATPADRTLIARWQAVLAWLHHTMRHMDMLPEQARTLWRGLRTVAEGRAAPTSGMGTAISDITTNLRRLEQVLPIDGLLLGLSISEVIDGLAQQYIWRYYHEAPPRAALQRALGRSSGVLTVCALMSATNTWSLVQQMPSSSIRDLIDQIGLLAGLYKEWCTPTPTLWNVAAADVARPRIATLAHEQLAVLRPALGTHTTAWQPMLGWLTPIVDGMAEEMTATR